MKRRFSLFYKSKINGRAAKKHTAKKYHLDKKARRIHNSIVRGRLAHLVEHRFDVARVIGSIPIATTSTAGEMISGFFFPHLSIRH